MIWNLRFEISKGSSVPSTLGRLRRGKKELTSVESMRKVHPIRAHADLAFTLRNCCWSRNWRPFEESHFALWRICETANFKFPASRRVLASQPLVERVRKNPVLHFHSCSHAGPLVLLRPGRSGARIRLDQSPDRRAFARVLVVAQWQCHCGIHHARSGSDESQGFWWRHYCGCGRFSAGW